MDHCKGRIVKGLVDYFEKDFRRITHARELVHVRLPFDLDIR